MNLLLFGGSGKLGSQIIYQNKKLQLFKIDAPTHKECDITNQESVEKAFNRFKPQIVINCAALVGVKECERNKRAAWSINVVGNLHIVRCCHKLNCRMVFISTNTVFDGKSGRYKETDIPNPTFFYAITKLAAEQSVKTLQNYVVIRLDFFPLNRLKYEKIFVNHYTSKIPVDQAAKRIIKISASNFVGTIHIGQERKSLYKILKKHYPQIKPIRIEDSILPDFPKDLSFDLSLYKAVFEKEA